MHEQSTESNSSDVLCPAFNRSEAAGGAPRQPNQACAKPGSQREFGVESLAYRKPKQHGFRIVSRGVPRRDRRQGDAV